MNQPFTIRRSSSRKDDAFNRKEAATIALKAKVKHLILGHYSTRYEDISLLKRKQISFSRGAIS
jgi:ribonuclease BN (tRNA processing enzyme)